MLERPSQTTITRPAMSRPHGPQLIFTTELGGHELLALARRVDVIDLLATQGYAVAICLPLLNDIVAEAVRELQSHGIELVAWLTSPPEDGLIFNAQNYPRADDRYQEFHDWALMHGLRFQAVGLEVAPPPELIRLNTRRGRTLVQELWEARDPALYLAARDAYAKLIATVRQDGYEVHTYQLPLIADDRRAGTTLVQRTLDILDLPTDLDVLLCSSSVSSERLGGDLEGALIATYGPDADAIGVGDDSDPDQEEPLPWSAFRRDLLLAAQYTDTIYVETLEYCVTSGIFKNIAEINWGERTVSGTGKRVLIATIRRFLQFALLTSRFGPRALAGSGWLLAAGLWFRQRRAGRRAEIKERGEKETGR
jgi:hypothetical protein